MASNKIYFYVMLFTFSVLLAACNDPRVRDFNIKLSKYYRGSAA